MVEGNVSRGLTFTHSHREVAQSSKRRQGGEAVSFAGCCIIDHPSLAAAGAGGGSRVILDFPKDSPASDFSVISPLLPGF